MSSEVLGPGLPGQGGGGRSKVLVITKREYLSRVRTAGFWITTVSLPLLMAAWMVLPSLIMSKTRGALHLAVVDRVGNVAPVLLRDIQGEVKGERKVDFEVKLVAPQPDREAQRAELDRRVLADEIDAWLEITPEGVAENRVEYRGRTVSNILTLEVLDRLLTKVLREQKLTEAGYDPAQIERLVASVDLQKVRVTEQGSKADLGIGELIKGVSLFVILYMVILIYGQMVMQAVLEEKSNRVVEVIAASTRPIELMAGKLIGLCAVALTQIGVWLVSAAVLTAPAVVAGLGQLPEGFHMPTLSAIEVVHFVALFLLGFTLFSSFYALIGSAFNNPQEAQQMATFGVLFVVFPWMVFMPVMNDPDSKLAVVSSLIPMFTPMIMMLRIAIKTPPAWQLALGYVLTFAFDVFMVWICARVYRVGILMYGKKPSLREIWRWARYS